MKRFATEIDMARSMQVCCAPADMLRLEDVLHAWFDDFNVHLELFRDIDGRTEWFYLVPAPLEESRMIHAARRQASRTRLRAACLQAGLMALVTASSEVVGPKVLRNQRVAILIHRRMGVTLLFGSFWLALGACM
ncbi:hypothetical protein LP419_38225 [Massilia sp. H-1]|nr:hypothetical protein LP419_38225 [Massilia sp. H-1]